MNLKVGTVRSLSGEALDDLAEIVTVISGALEEAPTEQAIKTINETMEDGPPTNLMGYMQMVFTLLGKDLKVIEADRQTMLAAMLNAFVEIQTKVQKIHDEAVRADTRGRPPKQANGDE